MVAILFAAVFVGFVVTQGPGTLEGRGLVPWTHPLMDDSRGARPGSPEPAASDSTALVGWINITEGGSAVGNDSAIENVLIMSAGADPPDGQMWDLGRGILHNTTGVTTFTDASDPDFSAISTILTDGLDWVAASETIFVPSGGSLRASSPESYFLHGQPDLVGHEIDSLRLNITSFSLTYSNGVTDLLENISWEIWGHPLVVFFVPPTDPDGTYLIDRNSTKVSVRLGQLGIPMLEWDGVNRSMVYAGSNWSASVSGLANGLHSYRVWATNATGTVYQTPVRHLTVAVGIWRMEHVGIGAWPSIAVNASGYPRMCFYEGFLAYAERHPTGWRNASIAGGGAGCSIALDSTDAPHISFRSFTHDGSGVGYASRNGTGWSVTQVDSTPNALTSIAINPLTDEPMISYADNVGKGLRLATRSEGRWSVQVVDPSFYGETTSLAIDASGHPAISYTDYTAGALRVARWTGSEWAITTVETGVNDASIKFDASGILHVAYASPLGLAYTTWDGTGWSTENVDRGRYYGVSLVFDPIGRAQIGYSMGFSGDVREAVKAGAWGIRVITHANGNGRVSLASMPQGSAATAFQSSANQGMTMATDFVDMRAPTTRIQLNGTSESVGLYISPVAVRIEADDEWSGVDSIEYRLDDGPWTEYVRTFQLSSDGRHVLEYRATDGAGNTAPSKTVSLVIDTNPFSFSGPLHGLPTIYIILASTTTAAVALWYRRRKRKMIPPPIPPRVPGA